ncbi:MAG: hypothetical protein C0436_00175 [Alphaproteobacteria bacterium]|nr:hypothetical protein [Alphaproteobacteria bacterium]
MSENIYRKLARARVAFQSRGVKMSGKNDYAGYTYYELSDILPAINLIGEELGFLCEVSFTDAIATLTVRDLDQPESVAVFTSPMSSANLKGCHEVQNLGAVETYIKRYLYQNAFEIVESDSLNKTHNPDAPKPAKAPPPTPALSPTPAASKPMPAQAECAKLSAELHMTDDEKRKLWAESGENWSNLLIMLKERKAAVDKLAALDETLGKVFEEAGK